MCNRWKAGFGLMIAAIGLLFSEVGFSQMRPQDPQPPQKPMQMPQTKPQDSKVYGTRDASMAEREADRLVALAPETIIDTLTKEPGLMLQVKRKLVKMAYAQGRLLEESELTDEALFRLIREDLNIRALATREIEDRNYIRPKPTKDEIAEQRLQNFYWEQLGRDTSKLAVLKAGTPEPAADPNAPKDRNQESVYWKAHEDDDTLIPPVREVKPGQSTTTQEGPPGTRTAREGVSGAGVTGSTGLDNLNQPDSQQDNAPMERIRPDDLRGVVATAAASSTGGGAGGALGDDQADAFGGLGSSRSGGFSPSMADLGFGGVTAPDMSANRGGNLRADARGSRSATMLTARERERLRPERPAQPQVRALANPYADIPSLYDLYSQVSPSRKLQKFGSDIFLNGDAGNVDRVPMDMPVGPDYVLGPGDGLSIQMWGATSRRVQTTVDSQGRVSLPEVGMVLVAGHSLGDVADRVQNALRSQFRDINADVSLSRLRSVRVYVVGEVKNPGAYEISGLSTPLNAINEAGGPTAQGSLRHIRHMRGKQLIADYDAYDLILHGENTDVKALQPGDGIVVSEIGPQVTVEGMVRRPAIYELRSEASLAEVLQLAGGVMSTGTVRHIDIERLDAHQKYVMTSIDVPEGNDDAAVNRQLAEFKVRDGDKIRIAPIVPYTDKSVYLDGHLFHPGKYAWREGMKVSDVIQKYTDLLPEPYLSHAEIIRLNPPNFQPVVIGFNLGDALAKNAQGDLALQPHDTVRVFGRFDFEDPPVVTVAGEVREPGDHRTNGVTRVSDAVYLAGGLTPDASTGEVQVYRKTTDSKLKVITVDLAKALNGDLSQNVTLLPRDRVIIHKDQAKVDPPTIKVEGEVATPGKYVLTAGMTASQAIELAGGLKRGADRQSADLARFVGNDKSASNHETVELAKAMAGDKDADLPLRDGDVLGVRQMPGWGDRGATITLRGEVEHPGTYGIREGEKLSSILERAGGLRASAYPYGAVLTRIQVRDLEEKTRLEMIRRIEMAGDQLRLSFEQGQSMRDPYFSLSRDAAVAQWEATLEKMKVTPPIGRLMIHITSDIRHWRNSANDIEVRAGDVLIIPKKPNFVMVTGAVYNPSAVSYRPGRSAEWYLGQGGGPTQVAKKSAMYVIHGDGSVSGTSSALLGGGLRGISVKPGDTVVVPEKAIGGPAPWQTIFQGAQSISSIAIAASVLTNNLF